MELDGLQEIRVLDLPVPRNSRPIGRLVPIWLLTLVLGLFSALTLLSSNNIIIHEKTNYAFVQVSFPFCIIIGFK